MQDCSNSSTLAMELLQSCNKPSILCIQLQLQAWIIYWEIIFLFCREGCLETINKMKNLIPDLFTCQCNIRKERTQRKCERIQYRIANNSCLGKSFSIFYVNIFMLKQAHFLQNIHDIHSIVFSLQLHVDITEWNNFTRFWPLWGVSTGHRWISLTRPVTPSFDVLFVLRLNKRLNKQSRRLGF